MLERTFYTDRFYQELTSQEDQDAGARSYASRLNIDEGSSHLDVSCGLGSFLLESSRKGAKAYGVDFSETAIRGAHRRGVTRTVIGDAHHLPFKGGIFDIVSCMGSLEHYIDPAGAIRELMRVGREGKASVYLAVPNALYPPLLLGMRADNQPIHTRLSLWGWKRYLRDRGLHVVRVFKDNHYHLAEWRNRSRSILRRLALLVLWLLPRLFAWQFLFVCVANDKEEEEVIVCFEACD